MRTFPYLEAALGVALLTLVAATPATAGGRLVELTIRAPSLEGNLLGIAAERTVQVYLPPSYDRDLERRYPTLYILHGIMDSNLTWTRPWDPGHPGFDTLQALMDAGIEHHLLHEMILVIPDSDKTCHYTDSPVRGNWERFFVEDLVDFVDARFRTLDEASARGITGHSMGGHGAIKLSMKYPHRFGAAYGMNPSLLGWGGDISAENPVLAAVESIGSLDDLADAHFYVQALVSIGHCFSPNPEAPLLTDLPFGKVGGETTMIQPGADRWQAQMPIYMVAAHLDQLRSLRGLRFDSAFEDEFPHIPLTSRELSRVLTEHGIEHTFEMYNGDHRNRLWGREGRLYTEVLPFFSELLERQAEPAAR